MAASTSSTSLPEEPASDIAQATVAFEPSRDRFAKEHKQKAIFQKSRSFNEKEYRFGSQADEELFNWYVYAGFVNPEAGLLFKEAATILRSAQGKYDYTGNNMAPGVPKDVFGYISIAKMSVFRRFEDDAQDFGRPSPLYYKPGAAQESLCQSVDVLRGNLVEVVAKLKTALSNDAPPAALSPDLCTWWDTINPDPAFEAIVEIVTALEPLSVRLWRLYEERKPEAENSPNAMGLQGLRRRRLPNTSSTSQVQEPSPESPETWIAVMRDLISRLIAFTQHLDLLVTQETLWVIVFVSIAISAAISGYCIAMKVDTAPKISEDPNFWSLLSQTVIQWLSLYATILPVLRKDVDRRTVWFPICLCFSAIASLAAPIVYPFSWQGALLLTYLSAAMSLIVSVFLAGNIEHMAAENDLPKSRTSERRSRRERLRDER